MKIGRAKKRDAPQDDHSSAEDTPQNGHDDDDDDAEDAPQDGLDNPTTSSIIHTPQDAQDTFQDGLGNPNVSGITPPNPANLVEPVLAGHETHFHVVTSGMEVGIFTNKYVHHSSCCFPLVNTLSRGVADARLQCEFPSSVTLSTWALAMAHYAECYVDGSVTIQCDLKPQTPINSPARKKRRSTFESPYSPLLFPVSPPAPKHTVNRRPRTSCELLIPKQKAPINRQKHWLTRAEARNRKAHASSPSADTPLLSPFASRARPYAFVDDNSEEEGAFAALVRLAEAATPIGRRSTPIIVHGSDSEEYPVSDIELTEEILKVLDAPVYPTTTALIARVAPSSSMVVERHSSPISIHASDSEEYEVSDIEFVDDALRLLDETN